MAVTWQGVYDGPSTSSADAVRVLMPERTVTTTTGAVVTVANPILLQGLSPTELAGWSGTTRGTTVRFRTTIGIIRFLGGTLIFTTSGGQRL